MGNLLLINNDVTSYYPNTVRLYGYSSRNQTDKESYVNVLNARMNAKHEKVSQNFLESMGVTNKELNKGLKLPINAYTGALRAKFNALFDHLQGFSICMTCQLLMIQLIYDLQKIPTLEIVEANT